MNRPDFWSGDIVWLSPKDIKADVVTDSELKITDKALAENRLQCFPARSLFIVARSGILKRTLPVAINLVPASANQDMKVLVPAIAGQERFLQVMLRGFTPFILRKLVKTGTTVQSLKYAEFEQQLFPIPPLPDQQRIVAKVDELMALCDQLEAARAKREALRDRLTTSTLIRLHAPDPATFLSNSSFALNTLPALSTRPGQIRQLRQSILRLAVCGKLVRQDPEDESASHFLAQIANFKARKRAGRSARLGVQAVSAATDEARFSAPAGWVVAPLGEITLSRDGERIPVTKEERSRRSKLYDYYGASGVIDRIDKYLFEGPLLLVGEDGANLINRSTPIAFVAHGRFWVNNHAHVLDGPTEEYLRYLEIFINAIDLRPYVTGTAQPKMNQAKMNSIPVALPPLAEQRRIVTKVHELMALCDDLEASLVKGDQGRLRLLEALLHEALEAEPGEAA